MYFHSCILFVAHERLSKEKCADIIHYLPPRFFQLTLATINDKYVNLADLVQNLWARFVFLISPTTISRRQAKCVIVNLAQPGGIRPSSYVVLLPCRTK